MKQKPPAQTEAEFQAAVIALAQLCNWRVAHFRPARTADGGWRTAVSADGAGFPDLVLVRGQQLIFAELKTERGKLGPEQAIWLDALLGVAGATRFVMAALWRPSDWPAIEKILTARSKP